MITSCGYIPPCRLFSPSTTASVTMARTTLTTTTSNADSTATYTSLYHFCCGSSPVPPWVLRSDVSPIHWLISISESTPVAANNGKSLLMDATVENTNSGVSYPFFAPAWMSCDSPPTTATGIYPRTSSSSAPSTVSISYPTHMALICVLQKYTASIAHSVCSGPIMSTGDV